MTTEAQRGGGQRRRWVWGAVVLLVLVMVAEVGLSTPAGANRALAAAYAAAGDKNAALARCGVRLIWSLARGSSGGGS
jgi:hypothetical protein